MKHSKTVRTQNAGKNQFQHDGRFTANVLADSEEARTLYLKDYISYLTKELNKLNLLEHSVEIYNLCIEIKKMQKMIPGICR
jgi:hypothetical protein